MEAATSYGVIYFNPSAVVHDFQCVFLERVESDQILSWSPIKKVMIKSRFAHTSMIVPEKYTKMEGKKFLLIGVKSTGNIGVALIVAADKRAMPAKEDILNFLRMVAYTRLFDRVDDDIWLLARLRTILKKKRKKDHLFPLLAAGTTALAIAITSTVGWMYAAATPILVWGFTYISRNMPVRLFKEELEILIDKWR